MHSTMLSITPALNGTVKTILREQTNKTFEKKRRKHIRSVANVIRDEKKKAMIPYLRKALDEPFGSCFWQEKYRA
jgi:hypothetical protein